MDTIKDPFTKDPKEALRIVKHLSQKGSLEQLTDEEALYFSRNFVFTSLFYEEMGHDSANMDAFRRLCVALYKADGYDEADEDEIIDFTDEVYLTKAFKEQPNRELIKQAHQEYLKLFQKPSKFFFAYVNEIVENPDDRLFVLQHNLSYMEISRHGGVSLFDSFDTSDDIAAVTRNGCYISFDESDVIHDLIKYDSGIKQLLLTKPRNEWLIGLHKTPLRKLSDLLSQVHANYLGNEYLDNVDITNEKELINIVQQSLSKLTNVGDLPEQVLKSNLVLQWHSKEYIKKIKQDMIDRNRSRNPEDRGNRPDSEINLKNDINFLEECTGLTRNFFVHEQKGTLDEYRKTREENKKTIRELKRMGIDVDLWVNGLDPKTHIISKSEIQGRTNGIEGILLEEQQALNQLVGAVKNPKRLLDKLNAIQKTRARSVEELIEGADKQYIRKINAVALDYVQREQNLSDIDKARLAEYHLRNVLDILNLKSREKGSGVYTWSHCPKYLDDLSIGNDGSACIGLDYFKDEALPLYFTDIATQFIQVHKGKKRKGFSLLFAGRRTDKKNYPVLIINSMELSNSFRTLSKEYLENIVKSGTDHIRNFAEQCGFKAVVMGSHDYNTAVNYSGLLDIVPTKFGNIRKVHHFEEPPHSDILNQRLIITPKRYIQLV